MRPSALLLFAALFATGCRAPGPLDYFPFVPGAERTMRVEMRIVTAGDTTEAADALLYERVVGEQDVPDVGRCWVVEQWSDSGPAIRGFFRRSGDSLVQIMTNVAGDTAELLFLVQPLVEGEKWLYSRREGQMREVVGSHAVVIGRDTLPGSIELVTRSIRDAWVGRTWLAPGVGPVKWERHSAAVGQDGVRREILRRAELVSYRIPRKQ